MRHQKLVQRYNTVCYFWSLSIIPTGTFYMFGSNKSTTQSIFCLFMQLGHHSASALHYAHDESI